MTETYGELGGRPAPHIPEGWIKGCGKPWCNHPDAHICPWMDETRGNEAIPCGCVHKPDKPMKTRGK
jgi:hypothetical protein